MAPGRTRSKGTNWRDATAALVVLVTGTESLLAERAVNRIIESARQAAPDLEVVRLDAVDYSPGSLAVATSPSLFADDKVVVLTTLEAASDSALEDATAYLAAPHDGVVVVFRHGGGQRGRRFLDATKTAGIPVVVCDPIRSDNEKTDFLTGELRDAGRRAEPRAVRALVEAVGSDIRELAAACAQLVADTKGVISVDAVTRYYGGRVEATGFQVADAAVAADAGRAVALLRHALATGVDPVPIVAALAAKLRTLAKVHAVRGRGQSASRDIGLAPWQIDKAAGELRHWTPERLAAAITAVAEADAEVKGAARDKAYAAERAVLRVARFAGN